MGSVLTGGKCTHGLEVYSRVVRSVPMGWKCTHGREVYHGSEVRSELTGEKCTHGWEVYSRMGSVLMGQKCTHRFPLVPVRIECFTIAQWELLHHLHVIHWVVYYTMWFRIQTLQKNIPFSIFFKRNTKDLGQLSWLCLCYIRKSAKRGTFEKSAHFSDTLFQISVNTTRQTRSFQHSAQTFLLQWD